MLTLYSSQTLQNQIELKKMNYAFENLNQPLFYLRICLLDQSCKFKFVTTRATKSKQQNTQVYVFDFNSNFTNFTQSNRSPTLLFACYWQVMVPFVSIFLLISSLSRRNPFVLRTLA